MSHYATLNQKLQQMFQINRPDLDFGVYRILNARRDEISDYLNNRLKAKVEQYLAETKKDVSGSQKDTLIARIKDEFGKRAFDEAGNLVDSDALASTDGQAYQALMVQSDNSFDEGQVYNHLATFFSRYYDEGDFISQRRYKGDTYAIPYSGEEVMLHWANKDQYYTKSSEMFSNYRIKFDEWGVFDKSLNFRLLSADTAKDNQKDNDKKRVFVVLSKPKQVTRTDEDGEEDTITVHPLELSQGGKELTVWFEYVALDAKQKQDKINEKTHSDIMADSLIDADWRKLLTSPAPTEKQPKRDLLMKHLNNYTTKNTADYFIHKDLGKFLNNELDFYIKNEVMHLDDVVNSESFTQIEKQLAIVKCVRLIGRELIGFLGSLEDFQKRLWLKKKFVVSSHYCVTLDRVDADLYGEIADNAKQWEQWESLGLKVDSDTGEAGWGTVGYLSLHPYLMVDTGLFDAEFKARLLRCLDDLDEQTDGVIIHSDNFQGLNLLQEKYRERIQSIYIDPPYNTNASEIIYKNGYKHSTWTTLINNTLALSAKLLSSETGIFCGTIDDVEQTNFSKVIEQNFNHLAGTISIRIKPSGRPIPNGFALSHEYALFAKNNPNQSIARLRHNEEQRARYREQDEKGAFFWEMFRKAGSNSNRQNRPTMFYPFYFNEETGKVRIPKLNFNETKQEYEILEPITADEKIIYPIKDDLSEGCWYFGLERALEVIKEFKVKNENGIYKIYYRRRPNAGVQPTSLWFDARYSATEHGTAVLKNLFGTQEMFSYPKSVYAVIDCLSVAGMNLSKFSHVIDYFAGSGTTAHATIALNREDNGKRKYILIEQGEYFNTVIKPRIQKVIYAENWRDGKPVLSTTPTQNPTSPYNGISHCLKVIKLESYEDTLNNLELERTKKQQKIFDSMNNAQKDDYLMHYMLDIESKGSLLSVADFAKPFDYQLKITADSAGAYTTQPIDLVDTFNYLIGLNVQNIDYQLERGYVFIEGTLRTGDKTLVFWRDTSIIGYDKLEKTLEPVHD